MYCTNCGAKISEGSKFCTQCGYPVEQEPQDIAPANMPIEAPAETPVVDPSALEPIATQSAPAVVHKPPLPALVGIAVAAAFVVGILIASLTSPVAVTEPPSQAQQTTEAASTSAEEPAQEAPKSEIPAVAGQTLDAAQAALTGAGFAVGSVQEQDAGMAKGTVISQSVTGEAKQGTTVDLVVSRGVKTFTVVDQPMTWQEAQSWCEEHGGCLASINSQEDWNKAVAAMQADGRKVYWLGGERSSGDSFIWIDNSQFSFASWANGEPNNDPESGGNEDYVAVFNIDGVYAWYDCPNDLSPWYKASALAFVMETFE